MYLDKTEYKATPELSSYIENLINVDETELEVKSETKESNKIDSYEFEEKSVESTQLPLWAEQEFKCLRVKSAGMNLMIPAMSISYVKKINQNIIRLPLEDEAFIGVLTLRERSVSVIDLFTMVSEISSSNNPLLKQVGTHHIEYVVVMEDGAYALACDNVSEIIKLNAEDVRWNKASFNNPMFVGVATKYLCPVVNIDNVQKQVEAMPFVQALNNKY